MPQDLRLDPEVRRRTHNPCFTCRPNLVRALPPSRFKGSSEGLPRHLGPRPSAARIDELISASLTKGPITKDSIKKEWVSLATKIQQAEAQGAGERNVVESECDVERVVSFPLFGAYRARWSEAGPRNGCSQS